MKLGDSTKLVACQYGTKCFRRKLEHLEEYVHPGDRNYRIGMVDFPTRKGHKVRPEFPTLRDLFNYCDPDESGNISQEEFLLSWNFLTDLPEDMFGDPRGNESLRSLNPEDAWVDAGGPDCTHLAFAQFAQWANKVEIRLPVGVDLSDGADKACTFDFGSRRCCCSKFVPNPDMRALCECCGHKCSLHLSDTAKMTIEEQEILVQLRRPTRASFSLGEVGRVKPRRPGFNMVTDKEVLANLQTLLDESFKQEDNWTRDRGCAKHGRNNCENKCIYAHHAKVPSGFELMRAEKNRNPGLYQQYISTRAAIKSEVEVAAVPFTCITPNSCVNIKGEEELDTSCNEWRVLHGTCLAACKGICGTNFKLKMAGKGASWKEPGADTGMPLYGYGVYLAESSTKADEYAEEISEGLPADIGCHAMLVIRVVGGLARVVETNEFDPKELQDDVLNGHHHSVYGDRVKVLKKPYREIVIYNNAQIFPEYILYYKRRD